MSTLKNKIDFAVVISVNNANPNGDPLLGNRPRTNAQGHGVITDVCLKRKLRNRLDDMGADIFFHSPDRCDDGFTSLQERAENCEDLAGVDNQTFADVACGKWLDVRAFGQLFAYTTKKKGKKGKGADSGADDNSGTSVSVGVRGPLTIQQATSLHPIDIEELKIVKCFNGLTTKDGKRGHDTMGDKFCVPFGVYVAYGSINARLAQRTGFTDADAELIHKALETLFENDESAARPAGSMDVLQVIWWEHESLDGAYSAGTVHRSLNVSIPQGSTNVEDVTIQYKALRGVKISTMEHGIQTTQI